MLALSIFHLLLWLEHPIRACALSSLLAILKFLPKLTYVTSEKTVKIKALKKRKEENQTNHLVHGKLLNRSCPQSLSLLPLSYICDPFFHLQHLVRTVGFFLPVVQGTRHGLGSSKKINEIKPLWTVMTDCLMSDVQTGVPLKSEFALTSISQKYLCQCRQSKVNANLFLKQLQLANSQSPVQAEYKNPAKTNETHKIHTTSILYIVKVLHW